MGITLSHRTAAGFTSEIAAWVATPQSPLKLNYIRIPGKVSLYLPAERSSSQFPASVIAAFSFHVESVLPLTEC